MADDDVTVELKDDEIEPKPGAAAPEGGAQLDPISSDIADVQRRLDEAEARANAAEARANQALERASQVETAAVNGQLREVQTAIETIDANLTTLEAQMSDAMAAGDFARQAQLTRAMTEQAAMKPDLLRGKAALEQEAKNPPPPIPQDPRQFSDQYKLQLYTRNMQAPAKAWIMAHPQYVLNDRLQSKLLGQHYDALGEGHVMGTDGYFRFIEDGLGIPQGNSHAAPAPIPAAAGGTEQPLSTAAAATQRRDVQPPPAAPSRGGGGSRTIKLTKAEVEAASMSGLSPEEYARNKERELKAGNIGKGRLN